MSHAAKLSVVLPVRDGQDRIADEVQRILDALTDIASESIEMVIVDDASSDATPEVLDELEARFPQVRVARHRQPMGMEVAGQTGLRQASGELVFIQEDDQPLRIEDMVRLYRMGSDPSVVAARAESRMAAPKAPLLQRLKAWGVHASDSMREQATESTAAAIEKPIRGLQMVRRPHLERIASRGGDKIRLESERMSTTSGLASDVNGYHSEERDQWFADRLQEAGRS